jgi:hypothetical protein
MIIMNGSNHHSNIKLFSEFFVVEGLADDEANNIIIFPSKKLNTLMWYKVTTNDKTV